jgi:hypothetical protein
MSGGRSPLRTRFGPVVGTSEGSGGTVARGGPGAVTDIDPPLGELTGEVTGEVTGAVGAAVLGSGPDPPLSQAASVTATITAKGMKRTRTGEA